MPTWRVNINYSFDVTSDELDDLDFNFPANRGGPMGDLLTERIFMEIFLLRDNLDILARFDLLRKRGGAGGVWKLRDTQTGPLFTGTDGRMVEPNEFRSQSYGFTNADVGRLIRVTPNQPTAPNVVRGHYLITNRIGPNAVNVEGVVPRGTAAVIEFEIFEPGEVQASLMSVL